MLPASNFFSGISNSHGCSTIWTARKSPPPVISDPRNFSFSDEITEMDDKLNFYIDTTFDVDAAFGTDVCTDKNDDYINLYADYDMESGQVCDELTIILWKGDGQSEEKSYTLNAAEKEVLLRKMDEYCPAADRHDADGLCSPAHGGGYRADDGTDHVASRCPVFALCAGFRRRMASVYPGRA
jgi:hypothetical protein